jgi:heterodisulfide reductase subunit C
MKIYLDPPNSICPKEIVIFQWVKKLHSKTLRQGQQQQFQHRMEVQKSENRKLPWKITSKEASRASSISLEVAPQRKRMSLIMQAHQVHRLEYSLNTIHHSLIHKDPSKKDSDTISL